MNNRHEHEQTCQINTIMTGHIEMKGCSNSEGIMDMLIKTGELFHIYQINTK